MTLTCDVPPSIDAAFSGLARTLDTAFATAFAERDNMVTAFDALDAAVLGDLDAIMGNAASLSRRPDITTVAEYRAAVGISSASREVRLEALGIHMVDGRGITSSGTNVVALRELWRLSGQNRTVFESVIAKAEGEFVIGVSYDQTSTISSVDGCGRARITTSTTEVISGIDVNVSSLEDSGIDAEDINIYVFWIGDSNSTNNTHMRMEHLGMDATTAALLINAASLPAPDGALPSVLYGDQSSFNLVTSVIIETPGAVDGLTTGEQATILGGDRTTNGIDPSADGNQWMEDTLRTLDETDSSSPPTQLATGRMQIPSLHVFSNFDMFATTGIQQQIANCRNSTIDDIQATLMAKFDEVIAIIDAALKSASTSIDGVFDRLEQITNDVLSLLGGGPTTFSVPGGTYGVDALASLEEEQHTNVDLLCLIGISPFGTPIIGGGIELQLLADLYTFTQDLSAGIDATLDFMLSMFSLLTAPICILQSILSMLTPVAGCVGIDTTIEQSDCSKDVLSQLTDILLFISQLIHKINGSVGSLRTFLKTVLPSMTLSYQSNVTGCIGLDALAFAAALEALV